MTQNAQQTPMQHWLETATPAELIEGAEYLKEDAGKLRKAAEKYNSTPGQEWIGEKVLANAEYSEKCANAAIAKATGQAA
jgi:hypothetical protein